MAYLGVQILRDTILISMTIFMHYTDEELVLQTHISLSTILKNNLFNKNKNPFKSADQVEFLQLIYKFSCHKLSIEALTSITYTEM